MRAVQRGWPLPLGALDQPRSLVSVDNLVDLIERCLVHPAAAGEVFLAADGEDWSTARLVSVIAAEMGRPCRLFSVPPGLLKRGGRLLGLGAEMDRLCDALQIDIGKNRERLQWEPPHPGADALAAAVRAFGRQTS
jgi:nucleoside-diphosphate-sugar epimerase